jgi:hypothetical protein
MVATDKLKSTFTMLGMNEQFARQAEQLGLSNLSDVMKADLKTLKKAKHFSFLWYADLLRLLNAEGLLHQFQKQNL